MRATLAHRFGCVAAALGLALVGGCSDAEPDEDRIVLTPAEGGSGHTHAPGQGHNDAGPIGDGTDAAAGGYRIAGVTLPRRPGSGRLSFRILDARGRALTSYVEEQAKLLHLYVVRDDLADFRHLHPVLDDGTWSTSVDLAGPGVYRVIAEFVPDGSARSVAVGAEVTVPGSWQRQEVPVGSDASHGTDGAVSISLDGTAKVGSNGRMRLRVTNAGGDPVMLGSYLGATAHVTGFRTETGEFVHVHPYGAAEQTSSGTELTFHTEFERAGVYRFFVQLRVDGFLHQVPITVTVSR